MEAALPVFRDYSPDEHLLSSSLLGPFTPMHTSILKNLDLTD